MAGFVTWFARVITGTKQEETPESTTVPIPLAKESSKTKGTRNRHKTKTANEEHPIFNTSLLTPIEDIIEETITEETKVESPLILKSRKRGKSKNQVTKPESEDVTKYKNNRRRKEDDIGYSFFKSELVDIPESKEVVLKSKICDRTSGTVNIDESTFDNVGFSFLPVKERGKRNKNKSAPEKKNTKENLNPIQHNQKKTKEDLSKPSIIDHYKKKSNSQIVVETVPVVTRPLTDSLDILNRLEEKQRLEDKNRLEFRESKKVSSNISYASIVTNTISENIPDKTRNENTKLDTEEIAEKIFNKPIRDIEIDPEKTKSVTRPDLSYIFNEPPPITFRWIGVAADRTDTVDQLSSTSKWSTEYRDDLMRQLEESNKALLRPVTDKSYLDGSTGSSSSFIERLNKKLSELEGVDSIQLESVIEKSEPEITSNLLTEGDVSAGTDNGFHNITQKPLIQFQKEKYTHSVNGSIDISTEKDIALENIHLEKTLILSEDHIDQQYKNSESKVQLIDISSSNVTGTKSVGCASLDVNECHLTKELEDKSCINSNFDKVTEQIIPVVKGNRQFSKDHIRKPVPIEEEKCVKEFSHLTESTLTTPAITENKSKQELKMSSKQQIRILTLNNQEHQECTLYRIEKNWAIQFRLGPTVFGRSVYLYCNYPIESNGSYEFKRDQYQHLKWKLDEGCKNADDTAAYTQITAKLSGSFHYYFTYEPGENAERQGSGYFLVDPILKYGNNENLGLDCIQCQTVLTKSLGSFSTWEKKLQVTKESGYNMIHFTPIQELGASKSSYSLSEQLKINPIFEKENGEIPTHDEIEEFVAKIRKEWKVTSICDIVLNHTANESLWIKEHPEVTYNCVNCPYMRPAYLLDAALHQFSLDVKKGFYEDRGIPIEVNHEDHLNAIRYHFCKSVLETLKLQELFICDVNNLAAEFLSLARSTPPNTRDQKKTPDELKLLQDPEYKRLSGKVDMNLALKLYNVYRNDTFDEDSRLKRCAEEFKNNLDLLNNAIIEKVNDHLTCAVENVIAGIRYFRVQSDGPKVKEITVKNPLVYRYFTDYGTPKTLKEHEDIMYSNNGQFLMAHNGWVMNSDPLKNFAAADSNIYIRRELIAWGDSVKLRFGNKPEDCPFLWNFMRKYVEQTVNIFDGVRLDNCHSTPLPVAEYLLDCARRIKPDLYVAAELFTNSDMTDNLFVNRLGITSLIREAMSAGNSHEEGRLVYRYGGYPVGSFYQPSIRPLVPSIAHALFLDLTHDNPSSVEKRSVFDLLPSTALVNMACCASGSSRGYDELVPHHIHVVDETRQYTEWTNDENLANGNSRYVTEKSGIISAKRAINDLHFTLGKEGFNQVYVDQMDPDIVAVTRHNPDTHQSYILVAFTAFEHPAEDAANYQRDIKPLRVEGVVDEIVLEATLSHVNINNGDFKFAKWEKFLQDSKWINGLPDYQVHVKQHIQVGESDIFEKVATENVTQLNFKNFKPGSIVVIKVSLFEDMRAAVKAVRNLLETFSISKETELSLILNNMSLADLNRAIYRCDQEERDEGYGYGTYNIPNFGSMVYAGLQGFMSLLANIRPNNDLGHPMCANLRDGNWMIDYTWKRLQLDEGTKELGKWIEENMKCFNKIPRYLVPSYFDVVVTGIYIILMERCFNLMSDFVNCGSAFVKGLSLGSVQFAAYIKSADLPILSPNLDPPKPPTRKNDKGEVIQTCVSLSAGLPHFAVGYMRNWGRDTFIALRGLFILTGRYEEARQHILGYAACLRHGLIPNLLDGGRNSRFNCRDAVWWWLYCIKDYTSEAPDGFKILKDKVSRIFPTDDSPALPPGVVDQPLYEVMQEALTVHFQGLKFRERNAGRQIDEQMTDKGFNNSIGIHPETGFVFGGNEWNCGTWMDKMGSSEKAGIRGKPATPRNGSAVELIGLSKAVITWLSKLNEDNKYPYSGVERTHKNGTLTKWTFKEWSDKIQAHFEKCFWVNTTSVHSEVRPDLINKRGIYKDCYGAAQEWTDYQLRCNFPIAMVAAPELFSPKHAWTALKQAEKYLLGPLGMKTLDPEDWAYRGDYDNSNDSNDPYIANGFNYHQGPEWVWPVGYFLRAKLHFAALNGATKETVASTKVVLSKHFTELQTSPWRGLPELTNSNGSYCNDSSRTQAWSMSCILEVLHDLQKIESNQIFMN